MTTDGRPCGQTALAEELHEEVDGPVDDARLVAEAGRGVDEAKDLDDPLDSIEIAPARTSCAETHERGIARGFLTFGDGQVLAEKALLEGLASIGDRAGEVRTSAPNVGDELGPGRIRF